LQAPALKGASLRGCHPRGPRRFKPRSGPARLPFRHRAGPLGERPI